MYDIVIGRGASDKAKFGKRGTILIGKQYVQMGQTTSLSNNIYMDIAGAHVISVFGKRGGGKCLHEDSLITLEDGSQVKIKDLDSDTNVISLNSDLKLHSMPKVELYKREVDSIIELKLRSGKTIKLTPEHPLLTVKGWCRTSDLTIGRKIATPRIINAFGNNTLPEHEIKILSYLLAEGHVSNGFILFTNKDEQIMNDFIQSIKIFDNTLEIKDHGKYSVRVVANKPFIVKQKSTKNQKGQFTSQHVFESRKSSLHIWLEKLQLYTKLSYEKEINNEIFTLNERLTSIFLNRLFSCDGSIYSKKECFWTITYSTSSEKMIKQVQHLLLKFGILSRFKMKKTNVHNTYELHIYGESVSKFIDKIGFFGYKEKRLKKARSETVNIKRNSNVDTIPKEIWDSYSPKSWTEIGKKIGYKHPKAMRESILYSTTRQKLLQIAKADESDLLERLATSDIYWDEIVGIEKIESTQTVYDITVPQTHNFVANDIIVHNSYTLGVIAEGLADIEPEIAQNLSIIILDTMGIYWTMKFPNKQDEDLLKQWELKPKGLDVVIYTPIGYYQKYKDQGVPTDKPFSIKPTELSATDWCMAFGIGDNSEIGVLIQRTIYELKEQNIDFDIPTVVKKVKSDEESSSVTKQAVVNLFTNASHWGLFDINGTPLKDLAKGGQISVLDVSCYATQQGSWAIKQMAVGLVAQKLFIQRMLSRKDEEFTQVHKTINYFSESDDENTKQKEPLVWLVIDEAHEFLPKDKTVASSDPLITILREGRQPGISLILASQQPGKIHTDVLTQSDTVLSHRITAKIDTDALGTLMQSYMRSGLTEFLDTLPRVKGSGVIFDDTNEKMFAMRIRPRFTWHGGSSPIAIPKKKVYFEK